MVQKSEDVYDKQEDGYAWLCLVLKLKIFLTFGELCYYSYKLIMDNYIYYGSALFSKKNVCIKIETNFAE